MHGRGHHVWSESGLEYDGEWKMGRMHGKGILTKGEPVRQRFEIVCDNVRRASLRGAFLEKCMLFLLAFYSFDVVYDILCRASFNDPFVSGDVLLVVFLKV